MDAYRKFEPSEINKRCVHAAESQLVYQERTHIGSHWIDVCCQMCMLNRIKEGYRTFRTAYINW